MKKILSVLLLIGYFLTGYAQQYLSPKDSIDLQTDQFIGIDSYGAVYHSKKNIFYKSWNNREWQYGDFALGEITSVSILNPLKIILFYESSNSVVIIDKYLTEIDRINFNTITEFKSVSSVSAANDNNLWVFDTNTQQIALFDTTTDKTLINTQPINKIPTLQRSNFNYCWVLTPGILSQFNIYGSLIARHENIDFIDFTTINNDLIALKEDGLYYVSTATAEMEKLNLPEIPIKQFYVTNEILYIYSQSMIYSFDLTPPKK